MLNVIVLAVLLASTTAKPRSKGDPLQVSIPAESGAAFQYNQNVPTPQVHMVPVNSNPSPTPYVALQPQPSGAVFQVNPITQEVRQVNQAGLTPGQQPYQGQTFPQPVLNQLAFQNPGGQASVISPVPGAVPDPATTNFQQPPVPQPFPSPAPVNYQQPPIPQAVPVQPQTPEILQGVPTQQNFQSPSVPVPQVNPVQPSIPAAAPQPIAPQQPSHNTLRQNPIGVFPVQPQAVGAVPSNSLTPRSEIVRRLIGNPPGGALLVGTNPPLFPIEKRLISNYTKLRSNVVDTFRCANTQPGYVGYGYYADVDNECQIFHICLPWKDLYPKTFESDVTYQFSFICPNQTVFSQDVLTCTYKSEAVNCQDSPSLYWLNDNFFRKVPSPDGFGTKYAEVNEPLVLPLIYDYDDFNPVGSPAAPNLG